MNESDENIELDVIGRNESGEPGRIHFEYISEKKEISLLISDVYGKTTIKKIFFSDKTLINFAKSVERIRVSKE